MTHVDWMEEAMGMRLERIEQSERLARQMMVGARAILLAERAAFDEDDDSDDFDDDDDDFEDEEDEEDDFEDDGQDGSLDDLEPDDDFDDDDDDFEDEAEGYVLPHSSKHLTQALDLWV